MHLVVALRIGGDEVDPPLRIANFAHRRRCPVLVEQVAETFQEFEIFRLIADDGTGVWPATKEVEGPLEKTSVDWEIYPEGLHHFLTWAHENYTHDLPIHVTENGMASDDRIARGAVNDEQRIHYLNAHLAQVRRALDDGVPVKSYFIWSLLDDYEWSLGYDKRFGLVHVDFDTLDRTPKQSWHQLSSVLRN